MKTKIFVKGVEFNKKVSTKSFNVDILDFAYFRYPTFINVYGEYDIKRSTAHFDRFVVTDHPEKPCSKGVGVVALLEVKSAEEAYREIMMYENTNNYNRDSREYTIAIEGEGFSMDLKTTILFAGRLLENEEYYTWLKAEIDISESELKDKLVELLESGDIDRLRVPQWVIQLVNEAIEDKIEKLNKIINKKEVVKISVDSIEEINTDIENKLDVGVHNFCHAKFPFYIEVRWKHNSKFGCDEFDQWVITNNPSDNDNNNGRTTYQHYVETAEEAVYVLQQHKNMNSNYERGKLYSLIIEGKWFKKRLDVIKKHNSSSYDDENRYATWWQTIGKASAAQQQKELVELLSSNRIDNLNIDEWAKELAYEAVEDQIKYLAQFI